MPPGIILALLDASRARAGKLGWTLRRIEKETGVRRETAAGYLRSAGVAVRPPGRWGRGPASKPATEVTTDLDAVAGANPANDVGPVTTDCGPPVPSRSPFQNVDKS